MTTQSSSIAAPILLRMPWHGLPYSGFDTLLRAATTPIGTHVHGANSYRSWPFEWSCSGTVNQQMLSGPQVSTRARIMAGELAGFKSASTLRVAITWTGFAVAAFQKCLEEVVIMTPNNIESIGPRVLTHRTLIFSIDWWCWQLPYVNAHCASKRDPRRSLREVVAKFLCESR